MDAKEQTKKGGDVAGRLLQKMLMPIVATAASAAATYAARKGPELIGDKVVPRVRELMSGAGGATQDLPAKAKSAAEGAGDVAERLTERARSVAGGAAKAGSGAVRNVAGNGTSDGAVSPKELDRRVKQREKARSERRKALR
jgi:hypothetical protein